MQEPRKQMERPAPEKSRQQLERERIYGEYAKLHPKEVVIEDEDDPRYFMSQEEIREFEKKKLAAEEGGSFQERTRAERERIFSKDAPPAEGPDDMVSAEEAWAAFRERNPEMSARDCELINSKKFWVRIPSCWDLSPRRTRIRGAPPSPRRSSTVRPPFLPPSGRSKNDGLTSSSCNESGWRMTPPDWRSCKRR